MDEEREGEVQFWLRMISYNKSILKNRCCLSNINLSIVYGEPSFYGFVGSGMDTDYHPFQMHRIRPRWRWVYGIDLRDSESRTGGNSDSSPVSTSSTTTEKSTKL